MILEVSIGLVALLLYFCYALTKNKKYWSDRGIPNTGFKFFWGDEKTYILQSESIHSWTLRHYNQFYGQRFFGAWSIFGSPMLLINKDFDLIRSIFIKDFDHFAMANGDSKTQKSTWASSKVEKVMLQNVQSATGDEWKDIRYATIL